MEKSERIEKKNSTNAKIKHSSASSDSDSDSPSDSSADSEKFRKEMKKLKKKIRKEERKTARRLKKKLKSEKRKQDKTKKITEKSEKNNAKLLPVETPMESVPLITEKSSNIPLGLMERAKTMAPMTKEEWEKRQSVVRKVLDEESGRYRLIKGDGEVLEEIVCQKRHKEINKQATLADGAFFLNNMRRK